MYCCYKTILLNKDTILDFNIVVSLIHIIGGIFLTLVKTTDFNWLLKNDNCRIYFSPRPSRLEFCFYRNRSRKTTFDKIPDFNWVLQNSLLAYAFRTTPSSIGCVVLSKPLAINISNIDNESRHPLLSKFIARAQQ